jgi:hypothetical protein
MTRVSKRVLKELDLNQMPNREPSNRQCDLTTKKIKILMVVTRREYLETVIQGSTQQTIISRKKSQKVLI